VTSDDADTLILAMAMAIRQLTHWYLADAGAPEAGSPAAVALLDGAFLAARATRALDEERT
jgi:hypothetical protein